MAKEAIKWKVQAPNETFVTLTIPGIGKNIKMYQGEEVTDSAYSKAFSRIFVPCEWKNLEITAVVKEKKTTPKATKKKSRKKATEKVPKISATKK